VAYADVAGWEEFADLGSRLSWVVDPLQWTLASKAERTWLVHRLHEEVRESWGLPIQPLALKRLDRDLLGYFDPDTGVVVLDTSLLEGTDVQAVIGTVVHENRHALQAAVLDGDVLHPLGPMGDDEVAIWRRAEVEYDPDDFVAGYMYNPLETDARAAEAGALIGYWKASYRRVLSA
jgi:hypothetical protein